LTRSITTCGAPPAMESQEPNHKDTRSQTTQACVPVNAFHQPSMSRCIFSNWRSHPRRLDSHKRVSGFPGAIQNEKCERVL